jgi:hypothetical protein
MKDGFRMFAIPVEGRTMRTGVFDGLSDYLRSPLPTLAEVMGGPKLTIVQVGRPTNGFEGRSSLALTHALAGECDSLIHWTRDSETFRSVVAELSAAGQEL